MDGFDYRLARNIRVCIFEILDDHSRYEVGTTVWPAEDTAGAWHAFSQAMAAYGPPKLAWSTTGWPSPGVG